VAVTVELAALYVGRAAHRPVDAEDAEQQHPMLLIGRNA